MDGSGSNTMQRWNLKHITGMLDRELLQKHDKGWFTRNTDFTPGATIKLSIQAQTQSPFLLD